jgi:hypothetical protein
MQALTKNKRYQAQIQLSGIQIIAPNSEVARKFVELGFVNVTSEGTGANRTVKGMWTGTSMKIQLPPQVKNVKEI